METPQKTRNHRKEDQTGAVGDGHTRFPRFPGAGCAIAYPNAKFNVMNKENFGEYVGVP